MSVFQSFFAPEMSIRELPRTRARDISIRELAKEADISPSVIQDLRSGKQHDIKVSNLVKIAHAFGYEVILQKGKKRLTFQEGIKNSKNHLSVIAAAS